MMGGQSGRRWCAWGAISVVCILLAACATPAGIADRAAGPAFDRTGRFALNVTQQDGTQKAVQGGFAWRDDGRELRLDLANPLGSILARVQVTPGQATLTRSDGSHEQAQEPNALVALVLGSPIPVSGLRDWLRGQTGRADVRGLEENAEGRISGFRQNGWQVALSRYDALGPRLLQMSRADAGQHVSVRLVVDGG